jgi:hypothetical protein
LWYAKEVNENSYVVLCCAIRNFIRLPGGTDAVAVGEGFLHGPSPGLRARLSQRESISNDETNSERI